MGNLATMDVGDNGNLLVSCPYRFKHVAKSIPGARWIKERKLWQYAAAPDYAAELFRAFERESAIIHITPAVTNLISESLLRDRLSVDGLKQKQPKGIKSELWKHQQTAYYLASMLRHNFLSMDMGTGKTLVALSVWQNSGARFGLVFCPKYVVPVWAEEAEKHLIDPPMLIMLNSGTIEERLERLQYTKDVAQSRQNKLIAIMNYDIVNCSRPDPKKGTEPKGANLSKYNLQNYLLDKKWDIVILDESQKIKAPGGNTSKFMNLLRPRASRRMCLSGTPAHNNWMDVYAQFRFLSPDIYGTSYARFKRRYAIEDKFGGVQQIINERELNQKFYRIAYRVTADNVLDLPEKTVTVRKCDLEPKARKIYNELDNDFVSKVEGGLITAANGAVKLQRLLRVTSGWIEDEDGDWHCVSNAKAELMRDILEDVDIREPIVIYTYFHRSIDHVKTICKMQGRRVAEVSGRMKDDSEYQAWRRGDYDVLVLQIRAGSLGIECTRARIGLVYELGLISPGDWDQAERRILRPGQERPVNFIHLQVRATRDVSVYRALLNNTDIIKYILDEIKGGNQSGHYETAAG